MAGEILIYLSLIIAIAAVLSFFARLIKQPSIIAYLITGVIAGPLFFGMIGPTTGASEMIQIFAHIGVTLLLFIVGLSLDFRVLREVGRVSAFAGFTEIAITGTIGFLLAIGLGFSSVTAIYLGAALAFSSTVVVVKILSDKKEIDTLHGRLALGILIIEDFVAAIALMTIPLINEGGPVSFIFVQMLYIVLLILGILLLSIFVLPKVMDVLARNQEVLFLFGIAWALVVSLLFDSFGFSIEIGALIAGMALASSKYTLELGGKIKPLSDFFVVLFFVYFGSQLVSALTVDLVLAAIVFSVFVIIGKPVIVMTILRIFGYKKRTNFLAGTSLAQISEFSLILILLAYTMGQIDQEVMSLAVLIAIITIGVSSYSIYYSHSIFNRISHFLNIFEGNKKISDKPEKVSYDVVLFGYHRIGSKVGEALKKAKIPFVVIDYNPKLIFELAKEKINCIYGDASDEEFLDELDWGKVKLVISTISDSNSNLTIKDKLNQIKSHAIFIATTEQPMTAIDFYKKGIDYVVIPQHLGGDYVAHLITTIGVDKAKYKKKGKDHFTELNKQKNKPNSHL